MDSLLLGDQPVAFEKLNNFINQDHSNIFRLFGSAGTGKTTIIAMFVMNLIKNSNKKVYFLASTNKAVKVLKEKTNYIDNKNIEFLTVDKFLNSIERINEFGQTYFCPKGLKAIYINKTVFYVDETDDITLLNKIRKDKELFRNPTKYCTKKFLNFIKEDDLIIIDECSMLNDQKWDFIKIFSICKIICTGDQLQLQPIESNKESRDSSVFTEEIDPEFDFEMTQILRTDDSKINKLYQVTRDLIDKHLTYSEVYQTLKELQINKTGMKEKLIKQIKTYLQNDEDFAILSYKNYAVNIFSKIVFDCLEDIKTKKYGYFLHTKYVMKTHYNRSLTNNTEFEIIDVINESGNQYILKLKTENNEELDLIIYEKDEYDKITSKISSHIEQLKKYQTTKSFTEKIKLKNLAIEVIDGDTSITSLYPNQIEGALIKLKQQLRSCILKNEEIFSLSYSLTIHKSQGSTKKIIIANLRDIYDTKPITLEMKARLLYVAVSRASDNVIFYI
jgi:hypothetical protein